MKNILAYYYSIHPSEISHKDDKYFFEYFDNEYVFEPFRRPMSDVECLYNINKEMLKRNLLVHEIILNNENKVLTYVNNEPYVLIQINVNKNARITLPEICHINNSSINIDCEKILDRFDWVNLWETKNDYFESQISEIGVKYPNLSNYANYYIGLAENAITYVRNIFNFNDNAYKSICHKRINNNGNLFELYHPMNFVCDYRVRDAAEYIKSTFFNEDNAYELVEEYLKNNLLSYKEALLFYGRLLYPSYFFDIYDDIVNNNLEENLIEKIINKSDEYEIFLFNVYYLLSKIFNQYIPAVDWIIKRSYF